MTKILRILILLGFAAQPLNAEQDLEAKIKEVILANPEIILMALQTLQDREEEAEAERKLSVIREHAEMLFPTGETRLVKFVDYRCGFCARSAETVASLDPEQQSKIRLVEFPILGEASIEIAEVALAVKQIGGEQAYRAFHFDVFVSNGRVNGRDAAVKLAVDHGHAPDALRLALASDAISEEIRANQVLARALGLTGTPAFVSRSKIHEGLMPIEDMKSILDSEDTSQ